MMDHDESTYLVIADAVRNGAMYWVDVIDVKPVGIFWLLGALLEVAGRSVFWMRVIAALFLALTAFFLSETKLRMGSSLVAAFAAGTIYLLLNSVFTFLRVKPKYGDVFQLIYHRRVFPCSECPQPVGLFSCRAFSGVWVPDQIRRPF
ncbi:MAG: hypothetical protein IPK21_01580 [Haliscomenobacter sp.]|nr:hypothetical protein [Haliscomenobacter sp.]